MEEHIDNEILISLVQTRPVLWDKTLEIFKDRIATRNAWKEVCCKLNKDFEDLDDDEKNEFGRAVIRRWTNLRDAFGKSKKKRQDCLRRGLGASTVKKYVYNDQMQYLNKLYDSRETADSLEDEFVNNEQLQSASSMEESNQVTIRRKNTEIFVNRKRRKPHEVELKTVKALEPEKKNAHMLFFQGVMPHLTQFNDNEVLEFQIGVLQLISNIHKKRKTTQSPTFLYHRQQFSVPQSPFSNTTNPRNDILRRELLQPTVQYFHNFELNMDRPVPVKTETVWLEDSMSQDEEVESKITLNLQSVKEDDDLAREVKAEPLSGDEANIEEHNVKEEWISTDDEETLEHSN